MSQSLEIQELAIAITAKQYNPKVLTPDFLKYSGIVPNDWELARPPIVTDTVAQVIFQNGVNIAAQVNKIVFAQVIATKESSEMAVGAITTKYVEKLPEIEYQAVGINFRGHVFFDGKNNTPRNYIFKTLLNPGGWHEFGQAPVQAAMRFVYTLKEAQLNLDINEAGLELPDKTVVPVLVFSANFNHQLPKAHQSERLSALTQAINSWNLDQETFKEVVNTKFLRSENYHLNLVPGETVISPAELV